MAPATLHGVMLSGCMLLLLLLCTPAEGISLLQLRPLASESADSASVKASYVQAAVDAQSARSQETVKQAGRLKTQKTSASGPFAPGWFGGFDQMESTFTEEGINANMDENPAKSVQYGWDPGSEVLLKSTKDKKGNAWFHESESGGSKAAWQTHYPEVEGSIAGNREVRGASWYQTPEGWMQAYNPSTLTKARSNGPGQRQAVWFDTAVDQYDGFGRLNSPYPETARHIVGTGDWIERAVNTSVACKAIGCTANATLQAFNALQEEATNCKLNINVHATDYDDDWSRENIDYWTVNGKLVKALCDPMAKGCSSVAARPLYSCLSDMPVDHLVDSAGALFLQGKLSKMVDECPYEGNLLSGVAMVTCLVRNKSAPAAATTPEETNSTNLTVQHKTSPEQISVANTTLRCSSPGCTAESLLQVDPMISLLGGLCFMNVSVVQTDFDDDLGEPENVEFVSIEGVGNLTADVQPGRNLCNERLQGKNVSEADEIYSLVKNYNVTDIIKKTTGGLLRLKGKISHHVDECASKDAYLFDAAINVRCTLPEGAI